MTDPPSDFAFETIGRPAVAETDPIDGAVDVPIDEPLAITFSTLMDTASVEAQLRVHPGSAHASMERPAARDRARPNLCDRGHAYAVPCGATRPTSPAWRWGADRLRIPDRRVRRARRPSRTGRRGRRHRAVHGIAIIFDRPIDPTRWTAIPADRAPGRRLARCVTLSGRSGSETRTGSVLDFTPSGALPPNTTFTSRWSPGRMPAGGGGPCHPPRGASRPGPDRRALEPGHLRQRSGRGRERVGHESGWERAAAGHGRAVAVIDYAVAPDGGSLVVADGRRLVHVRADGADRRVITADRRAGLRPDLRARMVASSPSVGPMR